MVEPSGIEPPTEGFPLVGSRRISSAWTSDSPWGQRFQGLQL